MCRTVIDYMNSFPGSGWEPAGCRIVWHKSGYIDATEGSFVRRIESPDYPCKPRRDGTPIDVQLPDGYADARRMLFDLAGIKTLLEEDDDRLS